MGFCLYALLFRCASCDDGINLALLLCLDAFLNKNVRDGDTDDNGEDDGDAVDAEAESLQELLDGDGLDVQDGKEETIEEHTADLGHI